MLKWFMLCCSILLLSITAAAQDFTVVTDENSLPSAPAAASPAPAPLSSLNRDAWELAVGYQYQHYNEGAFKFHNNGFNTDVVRYFTDWLGIEGNVAMGFGGNTGKPSNLAVKSLFFGGGPHISAPNGTKFEPFVHALFGGEHFRFTQTATLGSKTGFGWEGGGGVDYKAWPRVTIRVQADYLGTHFNSMMQNNYSFGSGFVFDF